ncbi:MAG: ParB/RepB/Spo0J family partition protein [Xanthomonadales bacterium]|nr:ParB/RepB/Spo0J family partition protein [Xanthomonadales bacterium]
MSGRRPKLGRGLDVLLNLGGGESEAGSRLVELPVGQLKPGRYQPRRHFDEQALAELAESIRSQGLLQPIVVRPLGGDAYEVLAGERRLRAARIAGLASVPCLVREADDRSALALALIENVQREDLNAIEQAEGLKRLVEEFGLSHEEAARAVGRSRAAVSNLIRLLDLPEEVRRLLVEGGIEMGHARALVTLEPPRAVALAREASAKGWSVRELERRVRLARGAGGAPRAARRRRDPDVERLCEELGQRLGTRVEIRHAASGRGRLVVHYHSLEQLDGILERIR